MNPVRLLAWSVLIFICAPVLVVVPMAFNAESSFDFPPTSYGFTYIQAYFSDPRWTGPTINSLLIGAGTAVLTLALVVPAAFALTRDSFRGRSWMNLFMIMPLTVPHIVIALGYYYYFGALGLVQSRLGVVLAHTCLAVPVAYLIVSATLKGFDRNLELAARNLGATPMGAFLHVTLPVLRPGFIAAALFSFIHSFDEAVVAIFISGSASPTLPRQMFDSLRMQADPIISVVSTLILAALTVAAVLPRWMKRRRERRLGLPS